MLARIGQIDLSIGTVAAGVDRRKVDELNSQSLNTHHEDCIHCAYQPICGVDLIDDIARYGRIDIPKHETWFCRQQTMIFDQVYRFLVSDVPRIQHSIAQWSAARAWPKQGFIQSYDTASAPL
jgi:hypothetical protein